MKSGSHSLIYFLLICLFSAAPIQAEVELELNNGEERTGDWIQWDSTDSLLLERKHQHETTVERFPITTVRRLTIDGNSYDQQTIRLAAENRHLIEPAQFVSKKHKRYAAPYSNRQGPVLSAPANADPVPSQCYSGCSRGVILGVHEDPLSAYQPLLDQYYPNGVPTLERGYALGLMRAATAQQALGYPPVPNGPPPMPGPLPDAAPAPFSGPAPISGQLTQISVQATPLNTEGKADFNALSVRLRGYDSLGNPARLSGQVRIHLYGERQLLLNVWNQDFAAKPIQTISLGEWTRNCANSPETQTPRAGNQFGSGQPYDQTWIVKLHPRIPEHNPNVYAFGAVQATLVSPGVGTFSASVPAVPLKHVSTVRDVSLSNTGTRILPSETTSAGIYRPTKIKHNAPSRPNSRTLSVQP